jgi:hypothetical protein
MRRTGCKVNSPSGSIISDMSFPALLQISLLTFGATRSEEGNAFEDSNQMFNGALNYF